MSDTPIEVSHTAMSDEGIRAVIERLPEHYDMSLNRADMQRLIRALVATEEEHVGIDDAFAEWAAGFVSTIAETVGVEFV